MLACKKFDPERIVGAGEYDDSLNITIGKSEVVVMLLFDTFSGDIENNQHNGWHYDHFRAMGVPDKPMANVELFGGWTKKFTPPSVYTEEGKATRPAGAPALQCLDAGPLRRLSYPL